jgi:hypothetical protein
MEQSASNETFDEQKKSADILCEIRINLAHITEILNYITA